MKLFNTTSITANACLALCLFTGLGLGAAAQDATAPEKVYAKKATWAETMLATREAMCAACASDPAYAGKIWELMEVDFPAACDWMRQDAGADCARWLASDLPGEGLKATIDKALEEIGGTQAAALRAEAQSLFQNGGNPDLARGLALYVKACEARRALRLRPLRQKAPQVVFTRHYIMGGSHYAYTEGQSDAQQERHFVAGSALCLLDLSGDEIKTTTLLEDPHGVIRDPDVSYDGRRILFAWKKSEALDDYHLYEMDAATRRVRQLTEGRGVADYEGAYLPGGGILFNSTRCIQTVDCFWTEVSNLYTCDGDGRGIRRLTFDQVHDNYPTVTGDGRILYTRWEYNDRGQIFPQPLFQMNADGTGQGEFYGLNSYFPTTILHARGIPGTPRALAIATGHHTRQTGKLIVIDPSKGREEAEGVQLAAPLRPTKADRIDAYGQEGELFQYPYPIGEEACLVAYHPLGWAASGEVDARGKPVARADSRLPRFGLYFMMLDGRRELLAADANLPCGQPVPLAARPEPRPRPSMVDARAAEGTYYVQDVYAGPGLEGVKRGVVKSLRVVKLDFRAAGVGMNNNDHALISTPVAIGNGAWDPKIILGEAKVFDDGSAFFKAPAREPVYFQLLDERGRMVQTMRSWSTLQPGENASCVGCHENKNSTPRDRAKPTQALRAGAQALAPFYGAPHGFSYVKEIQPILDRHCVRCHDGAEKHPFSLRGREFERLDGSLKGWSESYIKLTGAKARGNNGMLTSTAGERLVNWVSAQSMPPLLAPLTAGSNTSALIAMLDKGHSGVKLAREELDKLAAWIDLGVPFCGDYTEANLWTPEQKAFYNVFLEKRRKFAEGKSSTKDAGRMPALLTLELLDAAGAVVARAEAKDAASSATLTVNREYQPGDRFRVSGAKQVMLRLGAGLAESLVYAPEGAVEYAIPMGPARKAYPPAAFAGAAHTVGARPAGADELVTYRNLALNPWDQRGERAAAFPHASSNNECRNDPAFFARNAIDGNLLNRRHGAWPYESWGPDRGKGIWWRVEFGRPVQIDRLAVAVRADFPHDAVWPKVTVEFSDGKREIIQLRETAEPQTFPIRPRTVEWVRLGGLDVTEKPNNQGWCALSEVQVWGREAAAGEALDGRRIRYTQTH